MLIEWKVPVPAGCQLQTLLPFSLNKMIFWNKILFQDRHNIEAWSSISPKVEAFSKYPNNKIIMLQQQKQKLSFT
jgi:hypothetical protein